MLQKKKRKDSKETKASERFYIFEPSVNSKVYKDMKSPFSSVFFMYMKVRNYLHMLDGDV